MQKEKKKEEEKEKDRQHILIMLGNYTLFPWSFHNATT